MGACVPAPVATNAKAQVEIDAGETGRRQDNGDNDDRRQ